MWITFPNQSFRDLNCFCTNLLLLFIIRLNVSSLSPNKLHLMFYLVLPVFTLNIISPCGIVFFLFFVFFLLLEAIHFLSYVFPFYAMSISSLHFRVVFESSYQCIDVIFNAGESSSSFFSWHIESVYIISGMKEPVHRFSGSLIHLLKFFPRPQRRVLGILQVGQPKCLCV